MEEHYFSQIDVQNIHNRIIFLDIDGTVVADGQSTVSLENIQKIGELQKDNEIYFCSNKRDCKERNEMLSQEVKVFCLNSPYKKPNKRILESISNPHRLKLLVIGDKYTTDGLFAKNIEAEFIKIKRITASQERWWISLIYLVDNMVYKLVEFLNFRSKKIIP
jgi:predicted HAD superfamily phosphohydrolase YqeG